MSVAQAFPQNQRKAFITGATSGIGRAVAIQLARDGFEVIVHGRDTLRGGETVREIEATLLKRAATMEEIAEVVSFPASPRASYITGTVIAAHAGRTAI